MNNNLAVKVENVAKKYCKSLKRSMLYGIADIGRNIIGLSSHPESLRKNEFWAVKEVSFELKKGEVLGIIGPNGSGKTTLLKMLNGIFWPDKGKITVSGRVGALIEVGAGFHPMLTGRENIYVNAAILGMTKKEVDKKFDDIVKFADIGEFIDSSVKKYSSGMLVRLGFAIAVHCEPDILLIDEILAVGDISFIGKCFNKLGELKKKNTTIILVSHNIHHISVFSDWLMVLTRGNAKYFKNVNEGINEYYHSFQNSKKNSIEKILNGNKKINFYDIKIKKQALFPGETFQIKLKYKSTIDFRDVEIDTGVYSSNDLNLYFQATNKAYKKKICLLKGEHELEIKIKRIQINNNYGKVTIAIWSKNKNEKIFWWRIPVEFKKADYATGGNFLEVQYIVN